MADRAAKDALFEGFAEVARALASGRRAEIADLLAQGERPVEQIAGEIGQSVANTSHHLRAMARAGLVTTRRDGTRIFYALASDRVAGLWSALTQVAAEHVAGLERLAGAYLGSRDGIEVVGRDELAARLARGEVLVLDVRPAQNLLVVKTIVGSAQPVAAALDGEELPEVVGTIAGDDTILIICPDQAQAKKVAARIEEMLD